ncbi:MAG: hypothetical protein Q4E53_09630 [Eubacteriales bacterium]|nr:hypothetical protein [Eubacteriales bacterium]
MNTEVLSVIILFLQTGILIGQLLLSKRINDQSQSKEKGYFIIEKTNFRTLERYQDRFVNQYLFSKETIINLELVGESDVVLKSSKLSIDGREQSNDSVPGEIFYSRDNRFNCLAQVINFNSFHLQKDYVDITIIYNMENLTGYKYSEIIELRFDKKENELWNLSRFNIKFQK